MKKSVLILVVLILGCWLKSYSGMVEPTNEIIQDSISAANRGSVHAQIFLGDYYESKSYFNKDNSTQEEAMKWFLLAAQQGNPHAQYCVGINYLNGFGVKKNGKLGMLWLNKSADQGYNEAIYELGWRYLDPKAGVKRNLDESFKWFSKFIEMNNPSLPIQMAQAMYEVGIMYYKGNGTDKNLDNAFFYIQSSADLGLDDAIEWINKHKTN